MSRDWYRDHHYDPAEDDNEYRNWAQSGGAYVDAAGNVIWPDQPDHPDNQRDEEKPWT